MIEEMEPPSIWLQTDPEEFRKMALQPFPEKNQMAEALHAASVELDALFYQSAQEVEAFGQTLPKKVTYGGKRYYFENLRRYDSKLKTVYLFKRRPGWWHKSCISVTVLDNLGDKTTCKLAFGRYQYEPLRQILVDIHNQEDNPLQEALIKLHSHGTRTLPLSLNGNGPTEFDIGESND